MNGASGPRNTRLVTIFLPAKNEEGAIGRTLRSMPIATINAMGFDVELLVLDGHSTDQTAEIARGFGATVIPDGPGVRGKGAAVRQAIPLFHGEFAVMIDADGTYAADAIPRVLLSLLRDEADIVMAHRLIQPGSMTPSHLVGNVALSLLASGLNQKLVLDVCTGLWGFRTSLLRSMPLQSNRFGLEVELFSYAIRLGHRVKRVRVDYLPRVGGAANLSFGHDGLRILQRMMRARFGPIPQMETRHEGRPPPPMVGHGDAA
jgi:glycosyltransferase involved in cell wall biosynthesis